jgi:hypothetical protein
MLSLQVTVDTSRLDPLMRRFESRVKSATATALTRSAQSAQVKIKADIARVFDRPTNWALNSTRIEPARKDKLDAAVWLKNRNSQPGGPSSYLWPQVLGGGRERKGYESRLLREGILRPNEFTVPADGAPIDGYGNVPASFIRQMLSQLGAANAADNSGYDSNVKKGAAQSAASKRRQLKAGTFFVSRGRSTGNPLPRGIYQRKLTGFGWATRMVFAIVTGKPQYRARLPFFSTVQQVRRDELQSHFDREIARISQD